MIQRSKTYRIAAAAVFFAATALFASAPFARAEVVDRIVAVINDSIITMSELEAATAMAVEKLGEENVKKEDLEDVRSTVLDELIRQKLVKQAADRAGIDVSEREVDNAVDDIRRQNGNMTQEQLMTALARSGLTYREYRERLAEQIRQVKFMDREFRSKVSIQDSDVENYYRQHLEDFYATPSFRIRVIMISSEDPALMEKRLELVRGELDSGKPFSEVASVYSDGPNPTGGGDLGYVEPGELAETLEKVAEGLEPGEVSGPVERPEGTYIVKLVDRRKGEPRPLEEVRGEIRERLYQEVLQERFDFWLQQAKKHAHIEIRR